MVKIFKNNYILILSLVITLITINSFFNINKNFSKTQVKTKIEFEESLDDYEKLIKSYLFSEYYINRSFFDEIMSELNLKYLGRKKNFIFNKSTLLNLISLKNIEYNNETYITKKIDEENYKLFLEDNFKNYFTDKLNIINKKYVNDVKIDIKKCIQKNLILETHDHKREAIILFKFLDKVSNQAIANYTLPKKIKQMIEFNQINEVSKKIFMKCITPSPSPKYLSFFYVFESKKLINENFKIEVEFKNYENKKLIIFFNIIIFLTFIFINLFFKIIKNLKKKKYK